MDVCGGVWWCGGQMESCSNEISVYGPSYCTFIVRRMRFLLLLLNMCETLHNVGVRVDCFSVEFGNRTVGTFGEC
jgi:hypothetical protein